MNDVDKNRVLEALRSRVRQQLQTLIEQQRSTQQGAVHEETRAEDPKDTRAIEASYLARGLAERVESLRHACSLLDAQAGEEADPHEGIRILTLVGLVGLDGEAGRESIVFLVPAGGGEKLDVDGLEIRTITPQAPLGRALLGRHVDDDVEVALPAGVQEARVVWLR